MSVSPFQEFQNWLFDGNSKSKIPEHLLKSTSPISAQYCIGMFLANLPLNYFLDQHFNNINLWYLDKEELFIFIKKCVKDFKIQRRSLAYIPWKKQDKLYNVLRKKISYLKSYDIVTLSHLIDSSDNKEDVYRWLGLESDVLQKKIVKPSTKEKKKKEKSKANKIKIQEFLDGNFRLEEKE